MGKYTNTYADDEATTEDTRTEDTPRYEPDPEVRTAASRVVRGGWAAADTVKNAGSPYAQKLKVEAKPVIVKFLEDEPYTSYKQHWVERSGQKSFTCLSGMHPKGCPLCDSGDRPGSRFAFNVALLSAEDDPVVRSYEVGPRVIDTLKNYHVDPKMGPLGKHYWAISKTGTKSTTQTNHQMVKATDLEEDWDMDPLTPEILADLKKQCYTYEILSIPTYKQLQEIAAEELGHKG